MRGRRLRPLLWFLRFRAIAMQVLVPLIGFQFLRTLLLPTTFDVILLSILVIIYALFYAGII